MHQRRSLQNRENDFDLSKCELESFIALEYVRGLTYFIFFTAKPKVLQFFQKTCDMSDLLLL